MIRLVSSVGLVFGAAIILAGSYSNSDASEISDQSYFPLRVGDYRIYQVYGSDIHQASCTDTTSQTPNGFELKELIYDSVKNNEHGYTYLIHRYTRTDETQTWKDLDTWSAQINANQVVVTQRNTPFVKLVFPLKNNGRWNANMYNKLEMTAYDSLTNLGKAYQLNNGQTYPVTLTVSHDDRNFITAHDKHVEVYALSVGLIYRETTYLIYLQGPCEGEQIIESGTAYTQTLDSMGRE